MIPIRESRCLKRETSEPNGDYLGFNYNSEVR